MTPSLFISYASDDQPVALEVCALLEAQGVRCWIAPRDVAPGAQWDEAIVDAITASGAFLLILTAGANDSPFVKNEVNHAFSAQKPIFTFRAQDVQPSKSLGFYLARHHWTDGFAASLEKTVPQLATALTALVGADVPVATTPRKRVTIRLRSPRWRRALLATAAVAIAALGGYTGWAVKPLPSARVTRFSVPLPARESFTNTQHRMLALSPDGTRLAFTSNGRLLVRTFDQEEPVAIDTGDDNPRDLFFSHDGQWIGYGGERLGGQLKKVPVAGGAPVTLCETTGILGASWGDDDTIVFAHEGGISRVSDEGGTPELLISVAAGERVYGPRMLPDGRTVLFASSHSSRGQGPWTDTRLVVQSLDTGERTVVMEHATEATYLPGGHVVYVVDGALHAVRFDPGRQRVAGGPVALGVSGVRTVDLSPAAQVAVSESGTLAYIPQSSDNTVPVWVDREGRETPTKVPPGPYFIARLAPDGARAALDVRDEQRDIWVWDFGRETLTRFTFDPAFDYNPVWSPDGRRIAFSSARDGAAASIYWQSADGAGAIERLTEGAETQGLLSLSPDGRFLFADVGNVQANGHLAMVALDGKRQMVPLIQTPFIENNAEVSPDGRWVAYQSNETARDEIYVRPFPDVNGGRWQVSNGGGTRPAWSRNGRELFYYAGAGSPTRDGGAMMAVPITPNTTFRSGIPQRLFDAPYLAPTTRRNFDVTADGQRFLMLKPEAETAGPAQIKVVQNWIEELKRRMGEN